MQGELMNSRIMVLDPHVANLIAAGEVVERPASVVKELIENAVDAGSTIITVEIREGGLKEIRVTDNGMGMTASEARLAFLRHATSKIREKNDLFNILTLGFRGEALPSITAVSQVEVITRTKEERAGCKIILEGGIAKDPEPVGCPPGTQISVKNIFFNICDQSLK